MNRIGLASLCLLALAGCADTGATARADCDTDNDAAAIVACTKIIESGSASQAAKAAAYRRRGAAHLEQRAFKKVLADYTQAIRLQPNNAGDHFSRGLAYAGLTQNSPAIAELSRAIQLDKTSAEVYFERGRISRRVGQLAPALRDFSQAIRLRANYDEAYDYRAWTHYQMRRPAPGLADINKAIAIAPNQIDYYRTRAHILEALGRRQAAIDDYRRILRDRPLDQGAEAGLMRLRAVRPPVRLR